MKQTNKEKYRTIDLFAGIGGIRRGFEITNRFENVLSAEIDKFACMTYEHLYEEKPLNDVSSEEFKIKTEKKEFDVLLAGFPCQAFSIAGQKLGFRDKTRGTLFYDVADIIHRNKPKAFLLENVEGLTTHMKGQTFKTILEVLTIDLGYKIPNIEICTNVFKENEIIFDRNSFVRNTKNFGLPQSRSRVFIIGFRGDIIKNYKLPSIPNCRNDIKLYDDLNDVIELGADKSYFISSGSLESMKKHKDRHLNKGNGFGYVIVNDKSIHKPISNTLLATGGSGKERNLVIDIQPEIAGTFITSKKTALNSEGIRNMTEREWGKLQGFINYAFIDSSGEDKFSFPKEISRAQKYKQFGNSVSITVIESMANYISKILDDCL